MVRINRPGSAPPRPSSRLACSLVGCPRPRPGTHNYCSMTCAAVSKEHHRAGRIAALIGPSALDSAATELAEAATRYQAAYHQVHDAALSVGFTHEQWSEIVEFQR